MHTVFFSMLSQSMALSSSECLYNDEDFNHLIHVTMRLNGEVVVGFIMTCPTSLR